MRDYIETWIGTLDVHRNGGLNGFECPDNVTLDGKQCNLLFTRTKSRQGGHHYSISEGRIPN